MKFKNVVTGSVIETEHPNFIDYYQRLVGWERVDDSEETKWVVGE